MSRLEGTILKKIFTSTNQSDFVDRIEFVRMELKEKIYKSFSGGTKINELFLDGAPPPTGCVVILLQV